MMQAPRREGSRPRDPGLQLAVSSWEGLGASTPGTLASNETHETYVLQRRSADC